MILKYNKKDNNHTARARAQHSGGFYTTRNLAGREHDSPAQIIKLR